MPSKLKLDLNDLTVDSFGTTHAPETKGTVFGEQCTCWTNCTCPGCPTCDASCNGTCQGQHTCDASCNGTCYDSCQGCGGYTDWGCTAFDATCQNYGTCHWNSPCQPIP